MGGGIFGGIDGGGIGYGSGFGFCVCVLVLGVSYFICRKCWDGLLYGVGKVLYWFGLGLIVECGLIV